MEERDVPSRAHVREEIHERARPLGKLETVEHLRAALGRVAADQMAHVELRELVVGEIGRAHAVAVQARDEALRLLAARDRDAEEDVRLALLRIAVVEFGDALLAEKRAERAEAPRTLG